MVRDRFAHRTTEGLRLGLIRFSRFGFASLPERWDSFGVGFKFALLFEPWAFRALGSDSLCSPNPGKFRSGLFDSFGE